MEQAQSTENTPPSQLELALGQLPKTVLAHGLRAAHIRPLVSDGKLPDGTHATSQRVAPPEAWRHWPELEYARTGAVYAALVLDGDDPERYWDARFWSRVPRPNWAVERLETRHLHVCYCLASPVYRGPGAAQGYFTLVAGR